MARHLQCWIWPLFQCRIDAGEMGSKSCRTRCCDRKDQHFQGVGGQEWGNSVPATGTRPQSRVARLLAAPVAGAREGIDTGTWSGQHRSRAPRARTWATDLCIYPSRWPGAHACNCTHFASKLQAGLAASERLRIQAGILGRLRACADNLRDPWTWCECEHVHLFSSKHHAGLSGEEEAYGMLRIWAGLSDGPCCYSRDPQTRAHGSGTLCVFSLVNFSPEQLERTNRICIPILMWVPLVLWCGGPENIPSLQLLNHSCIHICIVFMTFRNA